MDDLPPKKSIGIAFVVLLYAVLSYLANNKPGSTHQQLYSAIAAVIGLACFITGCLHSLYRKTEV